METYSARLLSFYPNATGSEPEDEAEAGAWPITTLRGEDMAGAGFYFTGSTKTPDSVTCHSCKLQAWKWEEKDDPFAQHKVGSPNCDYIATDEFEDCHRVFLARQEAKQSIEALTPPPTPAKPLRKPRGPSKKKIALSKIMTVCDVAPSYTQDHTAMSQQGSDSKPIDISITAGDSRITIQINNDGLRGEFAFVFDIPPQQVLTWEAGTKRARIE
ncbi:baculoviral iap repeat-containing protein 3 [Colletotrichum karsti]|uniref:Baculoviral iap repeat-containing protein 3 n=1 Tax=Colletotrichum karsti TaxID=1095194 RepID=A0A9P6HX24_9PEZI|nr:baculoviral iap repeat-containing protein 3 [Colletotrichum karsti]KAF9869871.1 baculoviral iap repeat-containing protein 3 [Colletotrichum karsti]